MFDNHPQVLLGLNRPVARQEQAGAGKPGDFLSLHNDHSDEEIRHAAYVINLGREWKDDHGGLLQFLDEHGDVIDTMVPHFNTISLFRTPTLHCVSPVAAHATGSRLAITGWLMT
ncbi:MAG: 2OG-Fe(II) oxygenase [Wenzhouxiangella sp.]